MKIRTAYTKKEWLEPTKGSQISGSKDVERDIATEQIQRSLSEVIRCQNLVILSGLGTSLCLYDETDPPRPKAPTMTDLWEKVRSKYTEGKSKGDWNKLCESVRYTGGTENIEELLSACKIAENFLRDSELKNLQDFIALAEKEIRRAVNFLTRTDTLPVHSAFLKKIARRSSGKGRAKIFTTNYDLCFERAAKEGRFVVIDGFSPTLPPTFDPVYFTYDIVRRGSEGDVSAFIPNVFHLYKLHGSIDWERNGGGIEKKHDTDKPLLIYPRSSKYEQAFSQPYLEMMAALQAALREPNTGLMIIGFGFNDYHIAEPILSAIRSNLGLKVVIINPSLVKSIDAHRHIRNGDDRDDVNDDDDLGLAKTNSYLRKIMQFIDEGDARLSLLNGTFEDVSIAIPDITAETDLEKHMSRMKYLEGDGA